MEKLLTRIKNVVLADLNEILDKKENKNPLRMLNHYLHECEKETEKVRKLIERQYSLREEFQKELEEAERLAEKRKSQAEIATLGGEEELAQYAKAEQEQYENRANRLRHSLQQVETELNHLERRYKEMQHKLKDMKIRQLELMGKENTARANYRMNKLFDEEKYGEKEGEFDSYIDRLEKKVTNFFYESTIDDRIAQLEKKLKKDGTNLNKDE